MAVFYLEDFDIVNSFINPTHIDWELATDENFTNIIDSVYKDTESLNGWFTKMPKPDGGTYDGTTVLYIRCRIYVDNGQQSYYKSDWYTKTLFETYTRNIKIRYKGKVISEITYDENGNIVNRL